MVVVVVWSFADEVRPSGGVRFGLIWFSKTGMITGYLPGTDLENGSSQGGGG